ncbi:MAG: hypothetical protein L3J06_01695 [Cyclobacteriaceae bacterium]|nr:hypothetical protein [Cyclobacteriaceae bacterium]
MKPFSVIASVLILLYSCGPATHTNLISSYSTLNYNTAVQVFELNEDAPDGSIVVGYCEISDSGFSTNCSYSTVLQKAKEEARKFGSNAIKITKHKTPNLMSSCHRINVTLLKTN